MRKITESLSVSGYVGCMKGDYKMRMSQAKYEANKRYDAKNIKRENFNLLLEEDADLIEYIEEQKSHGYTYRQIIRELWENAR